MLQQQLHIKIIEKPCRQIMLCAAFFKLLVISLFVFSCTTEVDINWKVESQKYVVNCLFTPDEPVKLYAFKTSPILDDTAFFADGLDIEIYKNETLSWSGSGTGKGEYPIPVYAEAGANFKIILKDKNGFSISARDSIPLHVYISNATYLFPVYEDIYGSKFGKISLSFQDDPEVKNFYEIVILGKDSSINQAFNITSFVITLDNENDPNSPGTILFTDELFNGKQLDLNIFVNSYDPPIIVLKNISHTYYEYRKSTNIHFYNQNVERSNIYNMFKGDPVELYSNVSNGLGIFAGYTQDIKECTLINK
jgi:hypothetical protein